MSKDDKVREGQVIREIDSLKDGLATLEKGMVNIRDRLDTVLRKDTLDTDEKAKDEMEALVPLAHDIRSVAFRISMLNIEVTNLLKELEL